jgi:hypothetical protein
MIMSVTIQTRIMMMYMYHISAFVSNMHLDKYLKYLVPFWPCLINYHMEKKNTVNSLTVQMLQPQKSWTPVNTFQLGKRWYNIWKPLKLTTESSK